MTRRDLLLLILAFLITRAAFTAAGVLSIRFLPTTEGKEYTHLLDGGAALDMWYRWDAGFYASIATYGFDWVNEARPADDMAFLPLYPLAIHLVGGMTDTGCLLSPYLSTCATIGGVAVSNAALLLATLLLFDLAQAHYGGKVAWGAALLLLISPISVYLSGVYTESLFLLLTLLTFWLLERDRFVLAVGAAALACLTRSVGAALFVPLAWAAIFPLTPLPSPTQAGRGEQERDGGFAPSPEFGGGMGRGSNWRSTAHPYRIALAFVPPLIFAAYIVLAGVSVGDPLAYFKTYGSTWGRTTGSPLQAFTIYFSGEPVALFGWNPAWIDLIMTLVYLALGAWLLIKPGLRVWGLFALVALLIPIATGSLLSMRRFGATLSLPTSCRRSGRTALYKQVIVYGATAALALLFLTRFVTWHWIA
ncbi:MAG: mannosyltransferase family protein [Anaerolineae bacterium]